MTGCAVLAMRDAGPATQSVSVPASDGYVLQATLHQPAASPIGCVIINPATAVAARYYGPFASALANSGFATLTFDYRGIGASRPPALRNFQASMQDWIDLDAGGVLRWARDTFPGLPLLAVGHSVGGHAICLSERSRDLAGAVLVCTAAAWAGFIRNRAERLRVVALLRLVGPALGLACGYVPMSRIGMGEDLPKAAYDEWAGWILQRRYFFDDPDLGAIARFARYAAPTLLIGAEDDTWAPAAAIDLLGSFLTGAVIDRWQIDPAAFGGTPVGHNGLFRKEHQHTLWPVIAAWLLRQV